MKRRRDIPLSILVELDFHTCDFKGVLLGRTDLKNCMQINLTHHVWKIVLSLVGFVSVTALKQVLYILLIFLRKRPT